MRLASVARRGGRLPGVNLPQRRIALGTLLGALSLLAVLVASAGAATHKPKKTVRPLAKVRVEKVAFAHTPTGKPALLVAVRYPIQMANRPVQLGVTISGRPAVASVSSESIASGPPRRPERRHSFTFVHEIDLKPNVGRGIEAEWREGRDPRVTVKPQGKVDIDGDGVPDFGSAAPSRTLPLRPPSRSRTRHSASARAASGSGSKAFCASVRVVGSAPGAHTSVALPACTEPVNWKVTAQPDEGKARITGTRLAITAPRQPGTQTIRLNHGDVVVKVVHPWTSASALGATATAGPVVRAMGDSVTAGFGYYGDGSLMPFLSLYECKPVGTVLDDACSSNSTATKNGLTEVPYAPDYGLSNNISWAAQWANEYGVTNYKNYAVSGSEPTNWAPGGNLYSTTQKIESEDPDYILMTIGANPILANTLFGLGPMSCALDSDIFGGYEECVEEAFESVHLRTELKRLYTNLVENTQATIYLMQYHLSIPSSALAYSVTQIAEMAKLMNEAIAEVAKEVGSPRLQVISPPHFNVGVSLEPVYPSSYTCSYFEYAVDGPSVQSTPTQDELEVSHPLSFCEGPKSGPPWVISGDTGIHPSAAGYAQMASRVPPPAPQN
jgi:lysophospholipase L1-like esterase